jgi:PilZ domain
MTRQGCLVQRTEERITMKVMALLVRRDGTLRVETGFTENISSRGVRVVLTSNWTLDESIVVTLPGFHFTSVARVAYCDPLGAERFGIGLEFVRAAERLEITTLAAALQFSRT